MIQVLTNKTDRAREQLAEDVARFLQNGGAIQQVAPGDTGTAMATHVDGRGILRWNGPLDLRSPKPVEGKQ